MQPRGDSEVIGIRNRHRAYLRGIDGIAGDDVVEAGERSLRRERAIQPGARYVGRVDEAVAREVTKLTVVGGGIEISRDDDRSRV